MVYQFSAAAEAVGARVERFSCMAEIVRHLRKLIGSGTVSTSPLPQEYSELRDAFSFASVAEYPHAGYCVSFAQAGIARTGTLFLDLGDSAGRSATALAPTHFVLLKESTILPDLRAAAPILEAALAAGKNGYLSLTTGPSRTADIERVLTIGVHGPKELHILILEGV